MVDFMAIFSLVIVKIVKDNGDAEGDNEADGDGDDDGFFRWCRGLGHGGSENGGQYGWMGAINFMISWNIRKLPSETTLSRI